MAKRTVTMLLEKWQSNDLSPVDDDLTCGIVLELNHRATERQLIDILFMFPGCGLPVQWKGASRYASNVRKRVATAVGKKKMGSLPDVFSFAKKKTPPSDRTAAPSERVRIAEHLAEQRLWQRGGGHRPSCHWVVGGGAVQGRGLC